MEYSDYGDDRHCAEMCKTCRLNHCYLCKDGEGMDDEDLAAECIGYSWWDQIDVEIDGITHKVKCCKTGWF